MAAQLSLEIIKLREKSLTYREIAKRLNVTYSTIALALGGASF